MMTSCSLDETGNVDQHKERGVGKQWLIVTFNRLPFIPPPAVLLLVKFSHSFDLCAMLLSKDFP